MKRVVICGSTGTQGGAVFEAMKDSEDADLTGFTRDLSQPRVEYLRSQGLNMLEGDLADLDSLQKAFEGADCVFGLTQPWNRAYTKVPYVAARDIGLMTRRAFEEPDGFDGQVIVLVGDVVSGVEIAEILAKIRNERFKYRDVPKFVIRLASREFYKMRLAFEESGTDEGTIKKFKEAMEACRKLNPEMLSMKDHLKMEGWDSRRL